MSSTANASSLSAATIQKLEDFENVVKGTDFPAAVTSFDQSIQELTETFDALRKSSNLPNANPQSILHSVRSTLQDAKTAQDQLTDAWTAVTKSLHKPPEQGLKQSGKQGIEDDRGPLEKPGEELCDLLYESAKADSYSVIKDLCKVRDRLEKVPSPSGATSAADAATTTAGSASGADAASDHATACTSSRMAAHGNDEGATGRVRSWKYLVLSQLTRGV